MNRRTFLALTAPIAAAIAATATAAFPVTAPAPTLSKAEQQVSEPSGAETSYLISMTFEKGGKTLASPAVKVYAGQPATVQSLSKRPFVVGIDQAGKPIVQVVDEGVTANVTVRECQNDDLTLDVTLASSSITHVGESKVSDGTTVQKVERATQQMRLIQKVRNGETVTTNVASGTRITAKIEKAIENKN